MDTSITKQLKVLVACEYSGVVRDAFIKRGHFAMSCDLLPTENPEPQYVDYRIPRSMNFEDMDEDEFQKVLQSMKRHVEDTYFPDCDKYVIEAMIEAFGDVT